MESVDIASYIHVFIQMFVGIAMILYGSIPYLYNKYKFLHNKIIRIIL